MKKYIYNKTVAALALALGLSGCNSFLDEVPDKRTEINTPEKIQELLTSAYPDGLYMLVAESMSDNADDKTTVTENNTVNTDAYHWKDNTEVRQDTPTHYWNAAYTAIAAANQALESVQEIGKGKNLNYLKGEALVARAYAHFMLVTFWAKPYNPATAATDVALPYVKTPEKVVFANYKRISIKEYYDLIEQDLLEGIALIDNSKYKQPKFHFTKEAANGFATRFYLAKGEWEKVINHANAVLGNDPAKNLRNVVAYAQLSYSQNKNLYVSSSEPANLLISGNISDYSIRFGSVKYGLTINVARNIIGQRSHPTLNNWAYDIYGNTENLNIPRFLQYFKYDNISAGTGYRYTMASLLSYDEVLLNRVEANLMLGNTAEVIADLNLYLPYKTQGGTINPALTEAIMNRRYAGVGTAFDPNYSLTTQQREWLQCVADVRRAEFLHLGLRWFDIKRWGMTVTHTDSKGTYELKKDDPRREWQIPEDAVKAGLPANPR